MLMSKKKLLSQSTQPSNRITIQDVPTQFVELSDKDLQQIVGGSEPSSAPIGGGKKQD
jgi:bacteriocin-like protein